MHRCTSAFGNAAPMASTNPVRPSTETIMISSTPRFLISFNTPSQYFALSFPPIHIPMTSLVPSSLIPIATYTAWRILLIPNMYCMIGILVSITGSILGLPLSEEYLSSTKSYMNEKSTADTTGKGTPCSG